MVYVILTHNRVIDVDAPRLWSAYVNSAGDLYVSALIASSTYVDIPIRSSVSDYSPDSPSAVKGKSAQNSNVSAKVVEAIAADIDGIHPTVIEPAFKPVAEGAVPSMVNVDDPFTYVEDTEPRGSVISH